MLNIHLNSYIVYLNLNLKEISIKDLYMFRIDSNELEDEIRGLHFLYINVSVCNFPL